MKEFIKVFLITVLILAIGYYLLGYFSSYGGWYGYKKWKNRVATRGIEDSKRRGVFVKELDYKIDSFPGELTNFKSYIEKGFIYGYHTSEETRSLIGSKYPYKLSFNSRPTNEIYHFNKKA